MAHAANIVVGSDPEQSYEANWSNGVCYAPIDGTQIGDTLEFRYSYLTHNVYRMPNLRAFEECDFSQAILLADSSRSSYIHKITLEDAEGNIEGAGSLFFACKVGAHCYGSQKIRVNVVAEERKSDGTVANVPESKFAIGVSKELCEMVQRGEKNLSGVDNRSETSCSDPVVSTDVSYGKTRKLFSTTCLSKPFTMTPGGVINQATFVHFPYPTENRVLLGNRSWEIVQGDPNENMGGLQSVNVNQLYVHHFLGHVVQGAGAESIRRHDEDTVFPLPYGMLTGDFGNVMTFHFIDLRETGDKWLECVECRCTDGKTGWTITDKGSIQCCTNCTTLITPTIDYRLRYNVSWTDISTLNEPVKPIIPITTDIAPVLDKIIEFDVPQYDDLPLKHQLSSDPTVQVLKRNGTIRTLFSHDTFTGGDYHGPDIPDMVEIHRCLGHMHIGGIHIRLEDAEENIICSCNATYGSDPNADLGFITSINTINFDSKALKYISADQQITLVTHYNASEMHAGVMGLLTLFISEESGTDVGPTEALLNADICSNSVCDASRVPSEWECVDNIMNSDICKLLGICDCDKLLAWEDSPGCGHNIELKLYPDIAIDSLCAKTCGCKSNPDMETVKSSLETQFRTEIQQQCHYNNDGCRRLLSNMYSCSQQMPGVEGLDNVTKMVLIEQGSQVMRDSAKLGNSFMHIHRLDEVSNTVYPCDRGDTGSSDTTCSTLLGKVLPVVVAVFWLL